MRLDQALASQHGLSRTRAQDVIKAARVKVDGQTITKPSFAVDNCATIEMESAQNDYVSRAGGKLEAAFDAFAIDIDGQCVLDVGASTGGFTQVCLEHGAKKVYALDVGHLQLADALRNDPRVVCMEGVNIKDLGQYTLDPLPQFVCMDVSFISALTALQALFDVFEPEHLALLVKPQFECGPKALNKKGVIRHPKYNQEALDKALAFLKPRYPYLRYIPSPVKGRSGNQEWVVYAAKEKKGSPAYD